MGVTIDQRAGVLLGWLQMSPSFVLHRKLSDDLQSVIAEAMREAVAEMKERCAKAVSQWEPDAHARDVLSDYGPPEEIAHKLTCCFAAAIRALE